MSDDREFLTAEQALAMLPDGDSIHTFVPSAGGGVLIGADWGREAIEEYIHTHPVELSGETATRMKHGLAAKRGDGWLFIETKAMEETA